MVWVEGWKDGGVAETAGPEAGAAETSPNRIRAGIPKGDGDTGVPRPVAKLCPSNSSMIVLERDSAPDSDSDSGNGNGNIQGRNGSDSCIAVCR